MLAFRWLSANVFAKLQIDASVDAVNWFHRSIEANRNYPIAHFGLATALALLGSLDDARAGRSPRCRSGKLLVGRLDWHRCGGHPPTPATQSCIVCERRMSTVLTRSSGFLNQVVWAIVNDVPMPGPKALDLKHHHVFLASPGDVEDERKAVRAFFESYSRIHGTPRGLSFDVVDWENYSTAGVGRPQELITRQTFERFRESLVLVIGIMDQRLGSPSGVKESGTVEEYECAVGNYRQFGFPEVKWFFRNRKKLEFAADDPEAALAQWSKVKAFRKRVEQEKSVYSRSYADLTGFHKLLEEDLGQWLGSPDRPWFAGAAPQPAGGREDWPQAVVEGLFGDLDKSFLNHMRAGEEISPAQARARYVPGVLSLRGARGGAGEGGGAASRRTSVTEGPLADFLNAGETRLLVVSPGGGGKTTMLRQAAAEGAKRALEDPEAPVFLYVRLASFDRDKNGFEGLLALLGVAAGLDRERFESCWREAPRTMTILLDGLNEAPREFRSTCARAIGTLLQNSRSGHSYVITSRPGSELEAMSADPTESLGLRVAELMKFEPSQVEQYLEAQGLSDLRDRITGQLKGLAENPFLLWALTRTLAMTRASAPNNRGSLFTALVDRYIFEQREGRKPPPRPTQYNYLWVKKPVLAALALKMIEDGVVELAEDQALWQFVAKQLLDLEQKHYRALPLEPETFMPKDYAAASILSEVVNNGVVIRDGGRLRFMHESVQEYFAAVRLKDAPPEDLVRRAPGLQLAALEARGPMFEALVTWAGLARQEQVAELATKLVESHPLLAAHLAAESKLATPEVATLRQRFLALTDSQHEGWRELGALGLAVLPSTDSGIVARLIKVLEDRSVSESAERALGKLPAEVTVPALAKTWIQDAETRRDRLIRMLRKLVSKHQHLIAQSILAIWNSDAALQARAAELVARIDQKSWSDYEQRPKLQQTLLVLSAEAELAQNVSLSSALDALRRRAGEFNLPPEELFGPDFQDSLLRWSDQRKTREELAAGYVLKTDEELQIIWRDGGVDERAAALDVLVERRSVFAVEPVVRLAIGHPVEKWLDALDSLPRKEVRQQLAAQMETSKGDELKSARQLAILVEDPPKPESVAAILQNSDEDMRAMAIRSARRLGPAGIDLIIRDLGQESKGKVIEAGLRALAESGGSAAMVYLLDLLVDRASRQHWPSGRDELQVEVGESSYRIVDGWEALIHTLLVNAGTTGRILERLTVLQARGEALHSWGVLHEARRLLPEPKAVELLRSMAVSDAEELRNWALWSLARSGYEDAWRELLGAEMDAQPQAPVLTRDVARNLEATVGDPARRAMMVDTCRTILRSALTGPDWKRKSFAVQLSAELPGGLSEDWRNTAMQAALDLTKSEDPSLRATAIPALRRFGEDREDRILKIILCDPDKKVRRIANESIATKTIEARFWSALLEGDAVAAHRIAEVAASKQGDEMRKAAREMIVRGSRDQFVAAVQALAVLRPQYDPGEEWTELSRLAGQGFARNGVEETWNQFTGNAGLLDEDHADFVVDLLGELGAALPDNMQIVDQAAKIWPNLLKIPALGILTEIEGHHKEQAISRIQALDEEFREKVSRRWLAERWADVDRYDNAIREYRAAIQSDPQDGLAYFGLAWYLFLTGELDPSLESSRRAVELLRGEAVAFFNMGLALLAGGSGGAAEDAYRRGLATAKRQPGPRQVIEGALSDFPLLSKYPKADAEAARKIQEWLTDQCGRLEG